MFFLAHAAFALSLVSASAPTNLRSEVDRRLSFPVGFATASTRRLLIDVKSYGARADGFTDDTEAIKSALRSASIRGGILFFAPGTYLILSPLSIPAHTYVMCGKNRAVIKAGLPHQGVLSFNDVTDSGVVGCSIVAANGVPAQPRETTDARAIEVVGGASHIAIRENEIAAYEFGGIYIDGASHVVIDGNYMHDGFNTLESTSTTTNADIQAYGLVTDSMITNNVLTSVVDIGINVGPATEAGASRNLLIAQNIISRKNVAGVELYQKDADHRVSDIVVLHNSISSIRSRTRTPYNEYGFGIYVQGASGSRIEGNTLVECVKDRSGSSLPYGSISIDHASSSTVQGNLVYRSAMAGISTARDEFTVLSGNTIIGSGQAGIVSISSGRIRIAGNDVSRSGSVGIHLIAATYSEVEGNNVRSGRADGIVLSPDSIHAEILNNVSELNADRGMLVQAHESTMVQNVARDNSQSGAGRFCGVELIAADGSTRAVLAMNSSFDDQEDRRTQVCSYSVVGRYWELVEFDNAPAGSLELRQ